MSAVDLFRSVPIDSRPTTPARETPLERPGGGDAVTFRDELDRAELRPAQAPGAEAERSRSDGSAAEPERREPGPDAGTPRSETGFGADDGQAADRVSEPVQDSVAPEAEPLVDPLVTEAEQLVANFADRTPALNDIPAGLSVAARAVESGVIRPEQAAAIATARPVIAEDLVGATAVSASRFAPAEEPVPVTVALDAASNTATPAGSIAVAADASASVVSASREITGAGGIRPAAPEATNPALRVPAAPVATSGGGETASREPVGGSLLVEGAAVLDPQVESVDGGRLSEAAARPSNPAAAPGASPPPVEAPVADALPRLSAAPATPGSASGAAVLSDAVAVPEDVNEVRLSRALNSAVRQNGGGLTLRLTPAELGTVRINLQLQGASVSADFLAENEAGGRLLTRQLTQLRSALENQGLTVERLGVQIKGQALGGGQGPQSEGQSSRQDSSSGGGGGGSGAQDAGEGQSRGRERGDAETQARRERGPVPRRLGGGEFASRLFGDA